MPATSLRIPRHLPLGAFAVLVAIAYMAGLVIVRSPAFGAYPALAMALSIDLTIGVVVVAWLLLVRVARLPILTVVPIFLVSVAAASQVLPVGRQGLLDGLGLVAQLGEVVLIGIAVTKVVRIVGRTAPASRAVADPHHGDLLVAVHDAVAGELGPRVAALLATEIGVVAYGLGGWFRRPRTPTGALAFGYLAAWIPMLGAIVLLLAVETIGLHVLVSLVSPPLAWFLTALSVYGLLWLLADAQAARHRPILLTADELVVSIGLRWTVRVPRDRIDRVGRPDPRADGRTPGRLVLAMDGQPNVELRLSEPVIARGPFGIQRAATRLAIGLDDAASFVAASERRR